MTRTEIIQKFIDERGYKNYLEIGVFRNENFNAIRCNHKVSVDPDPEAHATVCSTSDYFFNNCEEKFDIVFIDGLHEHNQVWRDINNSLTYLNENGVIVMHDCMPRNEQTARWDNKSHQNEEWNGDVWKAYYKAYNELPYKVYVIPEDYGCGIIDTSKAKPNQIHEVDMEKLQFSDYTKLNETKNYGVSYV